MNSDLEIKLLKDAILALREELEKVRFEENEHIQQAVAGADEEIRQLRTSIVELRDRLEFHEAEHDRKLNSMELQHDREKSDLHKTIATLREKLEELNESLKKTRGSAEGAAAATSR
jgi:predicted  nucleic acid-binding Zn-ribbon protein